MKINMEIYGRLTEYLGDSFVAEIDDGATLLDLMRHIVKDTQEGEILLFSEPGVLFRNIVIQLNRKRIIADNADKIILKNNDEVRIYPTVSGG